MCLLISWEAFSEVVMGALGWLGRGFGGWVEVWVVLLRFRVFRWTA